MEEKIRDIKRDERVREEVEEEDKVVIRRVRSDLGTPGSSDTHVTQDTPTNEDDGLFLFYNSNYLKCMKSIRATIERTNALSVTVQ